MLTYRLTNCEECTEVPVLLNDIDCKLTSLAKSLYGNITLALSKPIREDVMWDLLNYKRILEYKSCNVEYASCYTLDAIASRIKVLINK